jgi:hypothetical protein
MDKDYIKDVMYGGISELMRNGRYYYRSTVGPEYSKWTEEGREAVLTLVGSASRDIHKVEVELELKRSKELMVKGLKGQDL